MKNHGRRKSLEVQKIRKSVKDEKIIIYYKPLLFVNTVFYIYSLLCLVDLWRSQTGNIILKYLSIISTVFYIFLFDYNGLIDYMYCICISLAIYI
jgi:hypothetical protein